MRVETIIMAKCWVAAGCSNTNSDGVSLFYFSRDPCSIAYAMDKGSAKDLCQLAGGLVIILLCDAIISQMIVLKKIRLLLRNLGLENEDVANLYPGLTRQQ